MLIKLLKEYGDFKIDDLCNTETDEDAQKLIDDGIAEKYVTPEPDKDDDDIVKDVVKLVKKDIEKKTNVKIPAQPKDDKSPWNCFGNFAKAVILGVKSDMLRNWCNEVDEKAPTGMGEAINVDGGFLIPTEFSTVLLAAMNEQAVIQPMCMNIPVNNNLTMPFLQDVAKSLSTEERAVVSFITKHWNADSVNVAKAFNIATRGKKLKVVDNLVLCKRADST